MPNTSQILKNKLRRAILDIEDILVYINELEKEKENYKKMYLDLKNNGNQNNLIKLQQNLRKGFRNDNLKYFN